MRMAQGEQLVKKWECRDEGENANGITDIVLTNRRIATQRTCKLGTETDVTTQEVLLESVRGVSYTNQSKETKVSRAGNWRGFIIFAILGVVFLLLFNVIIPQDSGTGCEDTIPQTLLCVFFFAVAGINLIIALLPNGNTETAYRIIIYTDATCTLNLVGEATIGNVEAFPSKLNQITGKMEYQTVEVDVPVTYAVAKEVAETLGALLVLAQYGAEA